MPEPSPSSIREEVERELHEVEEEASEQESERMAERDASGVDEPSRAPDLPG